MNIEAYINISIQLFGGLISLMIMLCIRVYRKKLSRLDILYIQFLLCNITLQSCNILSWLVDSQAHMIPGNLAPMIHFLMYLFSYLLIGCFTVYFTTYLQDKGIHVRLTIRLVRMFIILSVFLLIISQFQHWYYFIDQYYYYHRGNLYWLSNAMGILCLLPSMQLLIFNHNILSLKEKIIFSSYLLLPIVSIITMITTYGDFFVHIMTTLLVIGLYLFIQAEEARIHAQQDLELERRKTELMVSQMQPHFLFNVLTGIMHLCRSDIDKVYPALEHFSYYLRGNLDSISRSNLIPFTNELEHLHNYLYLEEMRFPDVFHITYQLDEQNFLLPPLTLQPLVENAIHHGLMKKDGGNIHIQTIRKNQMIYITITDDGIGFDITNKPNDNRVHVGMNNVKSRIHLMCQGTMMVESSIHHGTSITIILPQDKS